MGGSFREQRSKDCSNHGYEAEAHPPSCNLCLLVGSDCACVGRVRLASRFNKTISGLTMLLFGVLAAILFAFCRLTDECINSRWIAAGAARLICTIYFLKAALSSEPWFFWLEALTYPRSRSQRNKDD